MGGKNPIVVEVLASRESSERHCNVDVYIWNASTSPPSILLILFIGKFCLLEGQVRIPKKSTLRCAFGRSNISTITHTKYNSNPMSLSY